jgi:hypothetical protein
VFALVADSARDVLDRITIKQAVTGSWPDLETVARQRRSGKRA